MTKLSSVGVISTALRRPRTYTGWTVEAVNAARCLALYPLGVTNGALRTGTRRGDGVHDIPVILVHGFGHNRSGWFVLERELRRAGFTSVHTLNYLAGMHSVPALAQRVAHKVDQVRALTGAHKVHLIGHSLGGVLIRWYVQELGGDRWVDTAITVASPHEGTLVALPAVGRTARDLRPGSSVMRRLRAGSKPTAVRWVAYYSNLDVLVQPGASALLRHPELGATNVLVRDHGHLTIMVSRQVARSITEQLEARSDAIGDLIPMRGANDRLPGSASANPRRGNAQAVAAIVTDGLASGLY